MLSLDNGFTEADIIADLKKNVLQDRLISFTDILFSCDQNFDGLAKQPRFFMKDG